MKAYEDPAASPAAIGELVDAVLRVHAAELGHLAEFWLLLSLGEALAHPRQTFGHNAGNYRHRSLNCTDISDEKLLQYGSLIHQLIPARSHPSDIRAHVASIWAKRQFVELTMSSARIS
jgi:hypothetical protein